MKELSNYYGDNNNRVATVYKDENGFFATVKSATGVYYTARFETEEDAETYSEDWVNKDE
jgi:hypothetical protein